MSVGRLTGVVLGPAEAESSGSPRAVRHNDAHGKKPSPTRGS